jgi:aminopeptidase
MDPRIQKLANLLVTYSVKLKKGDLVKIQGEPVTIPLMEAVFEEALKAGANPYTSVLVPRAQELLIKHGTNDQLDFLNPISKYEVKQLDVMIHLWGNQNTRFLSGTKPGQQARAQRARKPVMEQFFKRTAAGDMRWVGTQFPTPADAQDAGMSPADYEEFVYRAGHLHKSDPAKHWKQVEKEQTRLKKILERYDTFHVQSADTDLTVKAKGRKWVSCHGTENFPDGEIFTSPIENSATGFIRFSYPASYGGREVEDVRLEFKKGKAVSESAARNGEYLKAMLDMDKGSRLVGEFAIGTNYEIKQFTRNTLFDEKIGGTCHFALGASIPEAGGKNKSGLHWDMVCDLKRDSEITADGDVIYRNGKFTI